MSQVHRSTIAQPIQVGRQRYAAFAAVAAVIAAAAVAGALIVSSPQSAPAQVRPLQLEQVTDGWMPAMIAARAARLEHTQDGYLPGLIAAHRGITAGSDARDGWESSLIR
jgi:hypothetical protein